MSGIFDYAEFYRYLDHELYPANKKIIYQWINEQIPDKVLYGHLYGLHRHTEMFANHAHRVSIPKDISQMGLVYKENPKYKQSQILFEVLLQRYLREMVRQVLADRRIYTRVEYVNDEAVFAIEGLFSKMLK